jgi:acyl carrier protein
MIEADIRAVALATLKSIAPEVDEDELRPDRPLRSQVDLDSMDWLNFLLGLHEKLGVEIPEADYARLVTLDDVVAYLAAAQKGGGNVGSRSAH